MQIGKGVTGNGGQLRCKVAVTYKPSLQAKPASQGGYADRRWLS
jgi:hypothetical protein